MKRVVAAFAALLAVGCATTKPAPAPIPPQFEQGLASWYGQEFAGRTTANGEIFDPLLMTAAHRSLPFGTLVDVHNPKTNQTVRVRINDRGPFISNRTIDLSYAAAQQIGLVEPGSGEVELTVVKLGKGDREPPVPYSVAAAEPPPISAAPAATTSTTPALAPAPPPPVPVTVENVQVAEEHSGVETRRQVSASGKTIETVPVQPAAPVVATPPTPPPASTEAPEKAPAPAPAPAPVKPQRVASTGGKFFVQAGAFSIEANAKALQAQLAKIGETSTIEHTTLFRVRIGPFITRDEALRERAHLESAGMSAIIVTD
jgi:rare lipoprotein A